MTDETPAETMRRAAKEMRVRAEAATRGPWRPVAGIWEAETFAAVLGPEGAAENAETWLMATGRGPRSQEADADHAASWHPGVALAIADLLEAEAWHADGGEDGTDHVANLPYQVALTYLGETAAAATGASA